VLSRNIPLQSSLIAPIPEIESIRYHASQIAAQLGEDIELDGRLTARNTCCCDECAARPGATPSPAISVTCEGRAPQPAAGSDSLPGRHPRRSVAPGPWRRPCADRHRPVPLTIAPQAGASASLHVDANGDLTLTPTCTPQVWPNQNVSLLLDGIEVFAEPFDVQTATPTFIFRALTPAVYRVRLRVDGVDSLIVNRAVNPPAFTGLQLEVLP
jgi:hypothetical protein